jgi:phospholipid/cholesterol/gamma-HCH transport system substrate-binding protein
LEAANRIVVQFWLRRDLRISQDSRALLQAVGVFGDVIVSLHPGASGTISLMDLAGTLGEQAEALLIKVDRLLADSTIDQVHGGVAALPGTVRGLEQLVSESSDEFAALSQSLRATAETLQGTLEGAEIDQLVAEMRELAATASQTAESLRQSAESLRSVADKIDRGEGTLGLLVNDPGLYEDLRAAAQNAASLTRDIRENPARYLKVSVF